MEMVRTVLASFVHFLGSPGQVPRSVMQIHAPQYSHRWPTVSAFCSSGHGGPETCGAIATNEYGCHIGRSVLDRLANHRPPSRAAARGHGDVSIRYIIKYN